ncbi:SapC family protein [Methylobacterium oxalidis]|uniref:SapC family protein n=1 Tax=Methylobacterium oxalidis TaxID=944322 RepID=A0A512IX70_9HYPH|nr:SapC family protein [Methylobacterium oxalidis]GEP02301.1 hypothetical protein MOX02_03390 [Methylobacterium oxalidis]GJE31191.1 hypothetical protein LDDCCGHA_1367 [Methylobacterium oxalidis]GLS67680.1 hypothetical protein GCM10007888_60650 [Methylobacterium oxalidis]
MSFARVALSPERLQNLHWSFAKTFQFARDRLYVPLIQTEILRAAREYPIAFVREGEQWLPVAYLGDAAGQTNRFVDDKGSWQAGYVPFWLRVYPFVHAHEACAVLLDPGFVGVSGSHAFTTADRKLTQEARGVADQVRKASAGGALLQTAASQIVEEGIAQPRPGHSGRDSEPLLFVSAGRPADVLAAKAGDWYARSALTVELAIAAAFSSASMPRAEPAAVTLEPPPEVAPTRPAPLAPTYVPPAAPADLDWLDMSEKISF